jgi:RNA recognition motif-containing protein
MPVSLFVGNLPYNATEAELRELFSTVGSLINVYLPTDRETGKLRGFAFVDFRERADAEEAIRRFNQQLFKGRPLTINEARAREERPRTSAPPRPPAFNSGFTPSPQVDEPPGSSGAKPARNFGPDATKRRSNKYDQKSQRGPKRPMRDVGRSQIFGGDDEDDLYDGDMQEDNFASREASSEDDE